MIAAVGAFFTASVADVSAELVVQPLPDSFLLPLGEVVVADAPRRQVLGNHAPGDAASHYAEDGVEHPPLAVAYGAPELRWLRYHRFQYVPFLVGEIAFHRLPIMGSLFQKALTKRAKTANL